MKKCAFQLKCLALTAIIENICVVLFVTFYLGFSKDFNYKYLAALESILFTFFLCKIKNGMVSQNLYSKAFKLFIVTLIAHILFAIFAAIVFIFLTLTWGNPADFPIYITMTIVVSLVFLSPRFIALYVARSFELAS